MDQKVTVKAFGGGLAQLIAVDETEKLLYVVNPNSLKRVASGETEPVGVPREDVLEGWRKEAAH